MLSGWETRDCARETSEPTFWGVAISAPPFLGRYNIESPCWPTTAAAERVTCPPESRTRDLRVLRLESGQKVADVCREHGISQGTYFRWKAKYGGLDVSEARRLRELEEENRRLKHAVAELTLDKQILKEALSRKW